MRKILVTILFIISSSICAGAVEVSKAPSIVEDPDLKLSIEELKKKYPIDWLSKKYGKQNFGSCEDEEGSYPSVIVWPCGPLCSNFPKDATCSKSCYSYNDPTEKNTLCSFFEKDPYAKSAPKSGWLVHMDFFSESEIKSMLVEYARQTIDSKNWTQSDWDNRDDRLQDFYGYTLYYFYDVNPNPVSEKEIRIKNFINSEQISEPIKHLVKCEYLGESYKIKNLPCSTLSTTKSE